jgi:uncharacterized Ntn-hydrolase superfamily protein
MEERLMDALDAGNGKGGDIRGMGSAGILVVRPVPPDSTSIGRRVDLRVDHHTVDPFKELRRIMNMGLAGRHSTRSTQLAEQGRFAEALAEQKNAVEMNPINAQSHYVLAQRYAQAGEYLNALQTLQEAIKRQQNLKTDASNNTVFAKMRDMIEFRRLVGLN